MSNSRMNKKSKQGSSSRNSASNRPRMLGNISENQLNSFLSIRKFEEKNFVKIGKSGVSAKSLAEEAKAKKEFARQNSNFIIREYSRATSQLRIPASVPLKLPNLIKELAKRDKVEKISVIPDLRTNSVKITLLDKEGEERTLVESRENSFKNHLQKDAEIGLSISNDSNLIVSIPLSPLSLESNSSKNQGNILYKLSLVGVEK